MTGINNWNYRVIEFVDPNNEKPWRSIHEVHYENGKPAYYSEEPAIIVWDSDEEINIDQILKRIKRAFDHPVLIEKDFQRK